MSARVISAESTDLFQGPADAPWQVVRVQVAGDRPVEVTVTGPGVRTERAATGPGVVEVAVTTPGARAGSALPARVLLDGAPATDLTVTVAEPGWTAHLVSHFHYDPVWWNTQAAYTSDWDDLDFPGSPRAAHQVAGFELVRAHLELALADPDYRFVLAEVDYLKPYWDTHPADRAVLRRLLHEGRVEIVGGAYNEPNTNLTHPETTVRNFVHGDGFQRHVLGADPRTAWQLDVFGHDPAFPGLAADAGLTSSSWARGPFHQWGPMEVRDGVAGDPARMQFGSEFEWLSPSGRGLLTSYMTGHYSAGWRLDSAATLADAEQETLDLLRELRKVATTRHVLIPVGTDYSPPNRWVTAIHHDWAARYTWPRLVCSLPRDFFAGVRAELAARGERPSPQTRDMNPIYTGKDVSYIDTKQANRDTEHTLLQAERFAVFARLLTGAEYPDAELSRAWLLLAYGAHHDGITGSESDQVYLDLLAGWREAHQLASAARDTALTALSSTVDGDGRRVVVWNPLDHERTDVVTVRSRDGLRGIAVVDERGVALPAALDHDGTALTFRADRVPPLGWRTYRLRRTDSAETDRTESAETGPVEPGGAGEWTDAGGHTIANEHHELTVDPARGGGVVRLVDLAEDRALIPDGRIGNELALYEEYPHHPRFGEGPWHLLPKGPVRTSADVPARVRVRHSPVGERIEVRGQLGPLHYTQTITLWRGVPRVDCRTRVDEFTGADQLLRVRWPCPVPGALPVSEVGNAVVGRGFGLIDVDAGQHPWTLDNPALTWFGLSAPASVTLDGRRRAIGVAEVVLADRADTALARDLVVALARCGVTATTATADGPRYGDLDVDSNLPDVRIALGGPSANPFTRRVCELAGVLAAELDDPPRAVRWIPAARPLREVWRPGADLRDPRALPVLVLAGADLAEVVRAVAADLTAHSVPAAGDLGDPEYANRTVALLNRGMPGFAVDTSGTLHASLLRSCTGWPSGTWINPPRRTTPDGSGFQLQHWSHDFDYALVTGDGDWRAAGIAAASAEFSQPLLAVLPPPDRAAARPSLPPSGSLLRVEPAGKVRVAALKAAGNPLARGSAQPADPRHRIALRLVADAGEPVTAEVTSPWLDLTDPVRADLLEHPGDPLPGAAIPVAAFDTATVLLTATPKPTPDTPTPPPPNAAGAEAVPHYARYWLHNRGPAPLGGLPVTVHLSPAGARVTGADPVDLRLTVAADHTDGELAGVVRLRPPDRWRVEPAELPFALAPGGHLTEAVRVWPAAHAPGGLHPVRAGLRLADPAGALPVSWLREVEDVALLVVPEDADPVFGVDQLDEPDAVPGDLLWLSVEPAPVLARPGERAVIRVRVVNTAHAPVAVEGQLLTPWGTWDLVPHWAAAAELPARGHADLAFPVDVPPWTEPGQWWALVKVAGAGQVHYSPAVSLRVRP